MSITAQAAAAPRVPDNARCTVCIVKDGSPNGCAMKAVAAACAAVAATRSWGLTGSSVEVASAGGILLVNLGPRGATLSGPTRFVGEVLVDPMVLQGLTAERREEVGAAL